jgi:hypothetical protein
MSTAYDTGASVSLEGLPKQFVTSLRTLYDILDENHTGYVRLVDIEMRWHEEGVKGLPSGVVDALRKVTPTNGYLTFERFVAGLKLALFQSTSSRGNGQHNFNSQGNIHCVSEKENRGRGHCQDGCRRRSCRSCRQGQGRRASGLRGTA